MDANRVFQMASSYYQQCVELVKTAIIRKLPNGKYRVLSGKGKNLGTYDSRSAAEKRLHQVEYFKHVDKSKAQDQQEIDLTDIDDFSYSAIMRKLRQKASKEQVMEFLKIFKTFFDKAVKDKIQKPEKIALQEALVKFNKRYPLKMKRKLVKSAAVSELGDATLVGNYLANIIRFTLNRIPPDRRPKALNSLKIKFSGIDENDIASKNLPPYAAIGQSITFVKHILFNQDARYVREVLDAIVRSL
jgi:hypothetical protein